MGSSLYTDGRDLSSIPSSALHKHSARFVTSYGPLPRPTRSQPSETRFWSFWVLSTAKKGIFVSCHPISLAISELTHNELSKCAKKILVHRHFKVLFQKRVRGFHQVSKHEKTFETTRPQAEWFYCFRVFGNLMKPEARVFVITSPTKKIRSTYHLNEFSRFKYSICGS